MWQQENTIRSEQTFARTWYVRVPFFLCVVSATVFCLSTFFPKDSREVFVSPPRDHYISLPPIPNAFARQPIGLALEQTDGLEFRKPKFETRTTSKKRKSFVAPQPSLPKLRPIAALEPSPVSLVEDSVITSLAPPLTSQLPEPPEYRNRTLRRTLRVVLTPFKYLVK